MYDRNDHFFKGDASMLKSIFVVAYVIIVIVWVGKEIIFHCKHVGGRHIETREFCLLGAPHFKNFAYLKIQILALLIP
jgi:hypothetical protein